MARRTTRRPGRPLAITDEGRQRMLNAIKAGTPLTYAADYAGITARTLHNYLARGEDADLRQRAGERLSEDDETMLQIFREVSRARAEVAVRGVALLQKVAAGGSVVKETTRTYRDPTTRQLVTEVERTFTPPDAKPMQWLLERTQRAEFGRSAQVEVTGADGGPVQVEGGDVVSMLAAQVASLAAERRREIEAAPDDDIVDAEVVE